MNHKPIHFVLSVSILVLAFCSTGAAAGDGKHLFILTGQSNMENLNPTRTFIPAVVEAFGQKNVIVVKDAEGGRPIRRWYKDWTSPDGNQPDNTGDLYNRLMKKVSGAIDGEQLKTISVVWMQGERDANEGLGEVYAASLKGLINQFRSDLERPDLHFIIGRLSDFDLDNSKYPDWTRVRKAQMHVARETDHTVWVNTDDLNGKQDKLHYTNEGYKQLGNRFARAAISLIDQ